MKMTTKYLFLIIIIINISNVHADTKKNGFDLSNSSIATDKIIHGGPKKDGIPAINSPFFLPANATNLQIKDTDRIMGIVKDGIARAYPINILNWHEIVNDNINGNYFSVTYCPLCGSGVVFDHEKNKRQFGVSGLLYNNDVLLYDKKTNSLWSQLLSSAISGKLVGDKLKKMPSFHTNWQDWRKKYPQTQVLSRKTGFIRNYNKNPYEGYDKNDDIYFPTDFQNRLYHPKERIIGLQIKDTFKAYPFKEIFKNKSTFTDIVANKKIKIHLNPQAQSAYITDTKDNVIITTSSFWFAWVSFHPKTLIYKFK
jgi:hypothetical protein